jgi:hypothetical protein
MKPGLLIAEKISFQQEKLSVQIARESAYAIRLLATLCIPETVWPAPAD